ncbi:MULTISPECIES: S41 family peptidase [unclassified Paenibacillus]|uniref:S41 family peptidase n=1 Tax=Paenibacillus provencensis TaxID=441151 RepID=A0ABW3QCW8_9BACL|nr:MULTISPECIES: S41 family peptidase [unclassified Paenibacillus]MCM3128249.1 S41 family peptidase [Paenibacillus sp. MER 78]SFS84821.1 carboxyl-terminal processing protease [Paenibacillus sp. 453mf]
MMKKRSAILLVVLALLGGSLLTLAVVNYQGLSSQGGEGLLASVTGSNQKNELQKIETALDLIEANYYQDVDRTKLIDGAINGMMESLGDPYSNYMGQETAAQFEESIEGSFTGIGAEVSSQDGNVVVVSPIKGSPAEKAGIQAKDVILSVNGESLQGLDLNDAVSKIRGPKGSEAKVQVQRAGTSEPLDFSIIRDDIDLETVYAEMKDDGVGVITITQFSLNTGERFKEELAKLESQNMKGLVIDVRNNPGGVLSVVIDIAEQFVPSGELIVQVEDKNGNRETNESKGSAKDYPVSVLMNKGSASASEILAGALQQSAGATLLGEHSFGKGTVQTSFERQLGDGSLVKITIAKWLTPNGDWIHEKGIEPDISVSQPDYFSVAPINKDNLPLKYDTNSTDVKNAQTMLEGLGYKTDRKDGYYDDKTVEAVKAFQTSQGLSVSGNINEETAAALETALIERIGDPAYDTQLKQAVTDMKQEISSAASN